MPLRKPLLLSPLKALSVVNLFFGCASAVTRFYSRASCRHGMICDDMLRNGGFFNGISGNDVRSESPLSCSDEETHVSCHACDFASHAVYRFFWHSVCRLLSHFLRMNSLGGGVFWTCRFSINFSKEILLAKGLIRVRCEVASFCASRCWAIMQPRGSAFLCDLNHSASWQIFNMHATTREYALGQSGVEDEVGSTAGESFEDSVDMHRTYCHREHGFILDVCTCVYVCTGVCICTRVCACAFACATWSCVCTFAFTCMLVYACECCMCAYLHVYV